MKEINMQPEEWYYEAINFIPEECVLKCFSAALKKSELTLNDEQKIEILKKRWQEIIVDILPIEELPFVARRMQEIADKRECKTGQSNSNWLTMGNCYYYVNNSKERACYDEQEQICKEVLVRSKEVLRIVEGYGTKRNLNEEACRHLYTELLAVIAIRCKFIAMLDFDYRDEHSWLRWYCLCTPEDFSYDKLKTESLAIGWAMYVLSRGLMPIDYITLFDAAGRGKTECETGFCYLMASNALLDAISWYAKLVRHFDYGKSIKQIYDGDPVKMAKKLQQSMDKWVDIVNSFKGNVMCKMDELLKLDREVCQCIEKIQFNYSKIKV